MVSAMREKARKILADVHTHKSFWCNNGKIIKNLAELQSALASMSEETFRYHCNQEKSDFANWVYDVIGDQKLAGDLSGNITRSQAYKRVTQRVSWWKARAS